MTFLNSLSSSLSNTSKDTLGPALQTLGTTLTTLTTFSQNQVVPALAGATIALDAFGKEKLRPALEEAGKFGKEKWSDFGPKMVQAGEYVKESAGPAMKKAGEYVKENPGKSAMYAVSGLTVLVPGLVSGPALWALGWGGAGVRAGSAAAAIQASTGNVAASSIFSTLQSAAMGGYGAATVNSVVQGCSAVVGGVGGLLALGNRTAT